MRESSSKEKILKKIRKALIHQTPPKHQVVDLEGAIYPKMGADLAVEFANRLLSVQGRFAFCENMLEFAENLISLVEQHQVEEIFCFEPALQKLLDEIEFPYRKDAAHIDQMQLGITSCEALIALTGGVMVSSAQPLGRTMTVYPPIHVVVAYLDQLVPDIKAGFELIKSRHGGRLPSMVSQITGPSRTADIEKTLVLGAHGPEEFYVFLVEEPWV
jgi:L-lactate dehydrogenase complex protein LldG